jgi:hypothetical protein
MIRKHFVMTALTSVLLICGCTPLSVNMIPESFSIKNKHAQAVSTQVVGSWQEQGNDMGMSTGQITNATYQEALDAALIKSQLFKQISNTNQAEYILKVELQTKTSPYAGFNLTASIQTEWSLIKGGQEVPVWKKKILSSHTTTAVEALNGYKRQAKSFEGAVRENIGEGIRAISDLDLD